MQPPLLITPAQKDLGDGFMVRRALPALEKRAIGPFVFLDEFGPAQFGPDQGLDVRPHPHIGLATVTYLFEGAIEHRDSLGTVQVIRPGDVNWMTAGAGIVHSERSPAPRTGGRLHGIQFWVGLPTAAEEAPPAFHHIPAAALPVFRAQGLEARLLVGAHQGQSAPTPTFSDTVYLDLAMEAGGAFSIGEPGREIGVYVVEGAAQVNGAAVGAGVLAITTDGTEITAAGSARLIAFGGAPLEGPRRLWWNFVSSSPERIDRAKAAWAAQSMGHVPGETEFIPLPAH